MVPSKGEQTGTPRLQPSGVVSQAEVAGRAGLKPKTVSGFETGKVCIQLDTLMRLLAVIGAAVEVKDREAIQEFKKTLEW